MKEFFLDVDKILCLVNISYDGIKAAITVTHMPKFNIEGYNLQ